MSCQHFNTRVGWGPQFSSSTDNWSGQWSETPQRRPIWRLLGHLKHHSSDSKNLSILFIDTPSPLNHVNLRPHNGKSISIFSSIKLLKGAKFVASPPRRVDLLSSTLRTALKSPRAHTFFPLHRSNRVYKETHKSCLARISQGAYTLNKKNSSSIVINLPWIIISVWSWLTSDHTSLHL